LRDATAPQTASRSFVNLGPGDPAPWFKGRTQSNPRYSFDTAAGRYLILCFFGSAAEPQGAASLKAAIAHRKLFDDRRFCFFGVSNDPRDEAEHRVADAIPGMRYFHDDGAIGRAYGALPLDANPGESGLAIRCFWLVLDPTMRIMKFVAFEKDGSDRETLFRYLAALPGPEKFAGFEVAAPILVLPNVFEPAFCKMLIQLYEKHGGEESGFMREIDGKTMLVNDHSHKRRRDYVIADEKIIAQTRDRVRRRVTPEILKVHQFKVTRMERYIVCCYAAEDEAHFHAHRDNTTKGTAHRRFAVSINLNDAFEGGEVSFPEYGPRGYKPPPGGAVVFSGSLLHAVSKVTEGRRFAFLPFLYDDAAAKIREENNKYLDEKVGAYKSG
jgi:predicted 2-oxoglutarate/Fe(II)-dependent dioxygenase YbiX/peroxiredoxin